MLRRPAREGELRCQHSGCIMVATDVVIDAGDLPRLSCEGHTCCKSYPKKALAVDGLPASLLIAWRAAEKRHLSKLRSEKAALERRELATLDRLSRVEEALQPQARLSLEEVA